jgi:PAS domain S-box-containing protein
MRISIRITLVLAILGLIWVTYILTTSSAYLSSQKVLRQHAQDIMGNIANLAMQESYTHLNHAQDATALTKRLLSADIVGSNSSTIETLEQYFYDNMAINPHFAGIYLGLPDGRFYDVRRHDGQTPNGFRTKIISRSDDEQTTRLIWRNADFDIVAAEDDPADDYDPRRRPWYIKAVKERQIVWTDPYIFFSSRKPGITIAGPSYDQDGGLKGVIGVDIEIDQLSTFIANLKIGKNGRAFMLNRNGDVVAHPNLDKLRFSETPDTSQFRLVKIDELNDAVSREAIAAIAKGATPSDLKALHQSRFAHFTFEGRGYTAMLTPFTTWEWPWLICVYLPEDDYLGPLKANRQLNMVVTFLISLVATAIGLYLARGIIQPISALESEATAIKNNDFTSETMIRSPYTELSATADSFHLMKKAVQTSQERYQGIFENIQDVYFEATMTGDILEVSPSIEKVFGLDRSDLIGKSMADYFVERDLLVKLLNILVQEGRLEDFHVALKNAQGKTACGSINAKCVPNQQGHPGKMIGSLRDITRRRAIEEKLENYRKHLEDEIAYRTRDLEKSNRELTREIEQRQSITDALRKREEEYFHLYNLNRMVTNNVPDLIWAKDLEGRYIFANQALCAKLLMCDAPQETFGKTDTYFAERERQNGHTHTFGEICENSDAITLQRRTAGRFLEDGLVRGTYLALDVYKAPFVDEAGDIVGTVGCGRDVTKEKAIEKELQRTEERFRELFENTFDMIQSVDANGHFLMVNRAWLQTLKYDEDDIIGQNLFKIIHPDHHAYCQTFFAKVQQGESLENIETTFVAKDGAIVHVVGNVTPRIVDGKFVATQAIFHNITDRKQHEQEILQAHAELEQRVQARTAELLKANDLLHVKIQESKQAEAERTRAYEELQSTQAQLIQAAKLASIGELASGVAHELNQPLMVIRGNAQLLKKAFNTPSCDGREIEACFHRLERNTKRMMNIINHLRSFSRQSHAKFTEVDVNAVLTDALLMVEEQLRLHRVKVIKKFSRDLPKIYGDANQLEQTFLNLLTNARDAIENRVATGMASLDETKEGAHAIVIETRRSSEHANMIEVRVSDSGCGIAREIAPKVFDPFFTTKQVGQGTGLGLSISYGIVQDHGGRIDIYNTSSVGSIFRITLPIETPKKQNPQQPIKN